MIPETVPPAVDILITRSNIIHPVVLTTVMKETIHQEPSHEVKTKWNITGKEKITEEGHQNTFLVQQVDMAR